MPLYCYLCPDCEIAAEISVPLAKCDDDIPCNKCGKPMKKIIRPVRFKIN